MKPRPKTSLIIATYNWPAALAVSIQSVLEQHVLPDEIIVADDGSGEATKKLITDFQSKSSMPIIHIWHEDYGFRLAEIRNKAICQASSDYIIQVDGDILMHPWFVRDHMMASREKTFLVGSRVLLDSDTSIRVQEKKLTNIKWYSKGINNRLNAMYLPWLSPLLKAPTTDSKKAAFSSRGCNMSFWKEDLIEVNGYDENMVGWGREDSELSARLVNAGLTKARLKFTGIQFHQFHKEHTRDGINRNDEILKNTIDQKRIYCDSGLSNHC